MKSTLTLSLFLISLLSFTCCSCSNSKKASESAEAISINVLSLTSQENYPGVESNLRSTRTYRGTLVYESGSADFTLVNFLVDSIQIPLKSFTRNGKLELLETGAVVHPGDTIDFVANRMFYNSESQNQILEEVKYELAKKPLEDNKGALQGLWGSEPAIIELGAIEKKASVFHP